MTAEVRKSATVAVDISSESPSARAATSASAQAHLISTATRSPCRPGRGAGREGPAGEGALAEQRGHPKAGAPRADEVLVLCRPGRASLPSRKRYRYRRRRLVVRSIADRSSEGLVRRRCRTCGDRRCPLRRGSTLACAISVLRRRATKSALDLQQSCLRIAAVHAVAAAQFVSGQTTLEDGRRATPGGHDRWPTCISSTRSWRRWPRRLRSEIMTPMIPVSPRTTARRIVVDPWSSTSWLGPWCGCASAASWRGCAALVGTTRPMMPLVRACRGRSNDPRAIEKRHRRISRRSVTGTGHRSPRRGRAIRAGRHPDLVNRSPACLAVSARGQAVYMRAGLTALRASGARRHRKRWRSCRSRSVSE